MLAWIWIAASAKAGGWSSFEAAFPMFPCQDGWMACLVSGTRSDPDLRGSPADWRVGWFDLAPSPQFSPFVALAYPATGDAPPEPRPSGPPKSRPKASTVEPPPLVPAAPTCSDLQALEVPATLGRLDPATTACLDAELASAPTVTGRSRISRLLLSDAWARGDRAGWEALAQRHLDQIDQSDADLCYKFALYLSGLGPARAGDAMRWADVALENRSVWVGDTYISRVFSLYKVRAAAAQALWQRAAAGGTGEDVDRYRTLTKVDAREWYEYARGAGKDATVALQLCQSAAGTADYCDVGP